jgi:Zn finger protein HypA/HybF involved in hydrogenase expression
MTDIETPSRTGPVPGEQAQAVEERRIQICDRCGSEMIEEHCKVACPNCGARWDCSDLSIYMD